MRILILGGDGYLGWPTAMYLSGKGHEVAVADNFSKRKWEMEHGVRPLLPISTLHQRVRAWKTLSGKPIKIYIGDLAHNHRFVYTMFEDFEPEAIVHYGEQPSAPYSMAGRYTAVETQVNNIAGTLNVLFAMAKYTPKAHLVKLGTMGEYGTPNIDIEEGWLEVEYKGRRDRLLFPKRAGSFYHLSKVHDSHNIEFACRVWGLSATDLNQGVVYGIATDETELHPELRTSFHYDHVFGTVLNRFCVQAVSGLPLTVYGKGGQTRGFLNILDTMRCVELAILNPAKPGEFRVFNQFTESFSVNQIAELVRQAARKFGLKKVEIAHIPNPRKEAEEHYYNPANKELFKLGLKHRPLSEVLVKDMMRKIVEGKELIDHDVIHPTIRWHHE